VVHAGSTTTAAADSTADRSGQSCVPTDVELLCAQHDFVVDYVHHVGRLTRLARRAVLRVYLSLESLKGRGSDVLRVNLQQRTQAIQLLRLHSIYYSDYTVYITQTIQYILLRLYSIYYSDYSLYSIYYSDYTVYITQTIVYTVYITQTIQYILLRLYSIYYSDYTV